MQSFNELASISSARCSLKRPKQTSCTSCMWKMLIKRGTIETFFSHIIHALDFCSKLYVLQSFNICFNLSARYITQNIFLSKKKLHDYIFINCYIDTLAFLL